MILMYKLERVRNTSFPDIAAKFFFSFLGTFRQFSIMLLEIYLVVVDYLLQTGATPLKWASQLGHKKIVALLLEHSTNVDMQDKVIAMKQLLPLPHGTYYKPMLEVVEGERGREGTDKF